VTVAMKVTMPAVCTVAVGGVTATVTEAPLQGTFRCCIGRSRRGRRSRAHHDVSQLS